MQEICIPDYNCNAAILHEITHTLGFMHEHGRPDRDLYVKVNFDNVPERLWPPYQVQEGYRRIDTILPYDYLSVLHYRRSLKEDQWRDVSVDPLDPSFAKGLPTFEKRARKHSFLDLMGIHMLYHCDKECSGPNLCPTNSFRGADCNCHCNFFAQQLSDRWFMPITLPQNRIQHLVQSVVSRTYICETSDTLYPGSVCGKGWKRHKDKCYMHRKLSGSWTTASKFCVIDGGRPVSPISDDDTEFLVENILETNDRIWINARYDEALGNWKYQDTGMVLEYANWNQPSSECYNKRLDCDGKEDSICKYTSYAKNYCPLSCHLCPPPSSTNTNNCLVMWAVDGKWRDAPCSESLGIVCQKSYGCEDGWRRLYDKCYRVHSGNLNWYHSSDACHEWGATLITSFSKKENSFLTQLLHDEKFHFAWLNAQKLWGPSDWKWMNTGTRFDWANMWLPYWHGYWPDSDGHPKCLMLNKDGWWQQRRCQATAGAICQKPRTQKLGSDTKAFCDNTIAELKCGNGGILKIRNAFYGRKFVHICKPEDSLLEAMGWRFSTNCNYLYGGKWSPTYRVSSICDGKQTCYVQVKNWLFNGNHEPCAGTPKYLLVDYDCVKKPVGHPKCVGMKVDPNDSSRYLVHNDNITILQYYDNMWISKSCLPGLVWSSVSCECEYQGIIRYGSSATRQDGLTCVLVVLLFFSVGRF